MSIPIRWAARMIVSPFSKGISRPSSLKVGMAGVRAPSYHIPEVEPNGDARPRLTSRRGRTQPARGRRQDLRADRRRAERRSIGREAAAERAAPRVGRAEVVRRVAALLDGD